MVIFSYNLGWVIWPRLKYHLKVRRMLLDDVVVFAPVSFVAEVWEASLRSCRLGLLASLLCGL
jgi:hypothetical protein